MEPVRPDIEQASLLEESFNIDSMTHRDLQLIYYDSIRSVFNSRDFIAEYNISAEMIKKINEYFDTVDLYLNGKILDQELRSAVVTAWPEHDHAIGIYREILRAIIFSMERFDEMVKNDGADFVSGLMFGFFRNFSEKYCVALKRNMQLHPEMQKYRKRPAQPSSIQML